MSDTESARVGGVAVAVFICGAKECEETTVAELYNEAHGMDVLLYDAPPGWFIKEARARHPGYNTRDGWWDGHPATDAVVRCPEHARYP